MGCFDMQCGLCGADFYSYEKSRNWLGHIVFTQLNTKHIQLQAKIINISTFIDIGKISLTNIV